MPGVFVLALMLALVACGDDGSPSGTDGGGVDGGAAGTTDAGAADAGAAGDSGTVARSDSGATLMCPAARNTRCGTACTGNPTMCLCTCGGGGGDFTSCDCVDGSWQCTACP